MQTDLCKRLGIRYPIIQAPMASLTTVEMVAAVSNAGALGSLGALALSAKAIAEHCTAIRARTAQPFNMNLFALDAPRVDARQIARALALLAPAYAELGAAQPQPQGSYGQVLRDQIDALIEAKAPVVSFHLGLVDAPTVQRLQRAGSFVIGTATNVAEAQAWAVNGADAVCAQGAEAGGHRGTFIGDVQDSMIGTMALVPQIVDAIDVPVIAAGGIMDGRGIAAALALGAQAVQMGTAFVSCAESSAAAVWRQSLRAASDTSTAITRAFTGRHARGIANEFTRRLAPHEHELPPFAVQSALTGELRRAAGAAGRGDFLAMWAGQAASLSRGRVPNIAAAHLVEALVKETAAAQARTASLADTR